MSPEQIFEAALTLPAEKREELMGMLHQTLAASPEIDDELFAELERRRDRLESGQTKAVPHEEAMAIMRNSLK